MKNFITLVVSLIMVSTSCKKGSDPTPECEQWYSREKKIYKPMGSITYSPVRVQLYCRDTLKTLFQGREIFLRETTDSLITLQFSNNGSF